MSPLIQMKKYTAGTPKSALGHTGPDSRSLTIQPEATGNVTLYVSPQMVDNIRLEPPPRPIRVFLQTLALWLLPILAGEALTLPKDHIDRPDITALTTAPFTPVELMPPLSTALPAPDHRQSSTTKLSFSLAWHGIEQLLKRVEPCLTSTPAKVPFNVLNTIIDIGKAVVGNKNDLKKHIEQTIDRLNVVNDALLKVESDSDVGSAMLTFAEKLIDEAVMLKGMSSNPLWEKIIGNEEDAKKIEGSFKHMDEHTKNFQKALYNADIGDLNTLTQELCTPGMCVDILEHIFQWAQDSSSNSPQIFWLTGDAGSGKSTIACTVAGHFDDETKSEVQNILCANFFCLQQFEEMRRQKYVIPTIIYQLTHQSKSYAHALLEANKFDSVDVLSKQMKDLLVGPWQRSASDRPPELPPYLVVVDALDEIDGQGGVAFL
ncbi:hypothetical protein L208DRAFT_1381408 [Tricholoma matsutake]|nr:hypothetical protein L208DRAFT_1381408 [Tricholoma matsutake 945]